VQANVRKCFDNIHHLRLGDPPQTSGGAVATVSGLPIDAMVSLTTRWPVTHVCVRPEGDCGGSLRLLLSGVVGCISCVSAVLLVSP
jgi:hypothetical protein